MCAICDVVVSAVESMPRPSRPITARCHSEEPAFFRRRGICCWFERWKRKQIPARPCLSGRQAGLVALNCGLARDDTALVFERQTKVIGRACRSSPAGVRRGGRPAKANAQPCRHSERSEESLFGFAQTFRRDPSVAILPQDDDPHRIVSLCRGRWRRGRAWPRGQAW